MVRATNLLTTFPTTISRTPPFAFRNAVILPILMASITVGVMSLRNLLRQLAQTLLVRDKIQERA